MKNILIIIAALLGIGAFGQTNIPTRQMMADMNGVVKWPTNITSITIGGRTYTNLLGFGLALTNGQLSIDTTQLPSGGGGGGSGTVTSVGLSTSLSGLSVGSSPVTSSGTITLSGTLGLGSGGTGATDAPGARTALSLVPGTDVQAYDADLAAIAALANSGIIVRTGSGTVSARTITGDSEVVVSNGDGVSGNPTLSIGSAIARDSEVAAGYQPLDADLTTLATLNGASLTNLNGTEIRSGTVADARIDSAIARDSEVSSAYQPLDADLTAMAAGTAVATAQTNAVSVGAPVLYVGTTNVAEAIAGISGGGGNVYTSSNNVMTGTNTFSGMITLGSLSRTNFLPSATELYFFTEFLTGTSGTTTTAFLPFQGNAINSGTVAAAQGLTNHPGIITVASASGTANSGYAYTCNATALIPRPGDFFRVSFRPFQTNLGTRVYLGFLDQGGAASAPTDGFCLFRSNATIYGQAWNNSVLVQTVNSATITSNTWYSAWGHIVNDSVAQFIVTDETGASVLNETVTNGIPFTRGYGAGFVAFYTNSPGASANLEQFDNVHVGSMRNILR